MSLPLQVAFITGQSDPERCALSPLQAAFLDALPVPDAGKVRVNFPYTTTTLPHRRVALGPASWHNGRQYLGSRAPAFAERHRAGALALLSRADRTVLLAGSCGLELLANLGLPDSALRRVAVFAYGPVARRRPACEVVVVQGRRDWISRAWGPHADEVVEAGHLDYLRDAEVLAHARAFIVRVASRADAVAP